MSNPIDNFKAGCSGKAPFMTFAKANETAKRMRKSRRECHVEAYHCTHCQQYHVGENRSYHPKTRENHAPPSADQD